MHTNAHRYPNQQMSLALPTTLVAEAFANTLQLTWSRSPALFDGQNVVKACPERYCRECLVVHQRKHCTPSAAQGWRPVQPKAAILATGEEVQHWIWLLRTFSDRCCVTHLNARLLYMVSLASLNCVGFNEHVLEKPALLSINEHMQALSGFRMSYHIYTYTCMSIMTSTVMTALTGSQLSFLHDTLLHDGQTPLRITSVESYRPRFHARSAVRSLGCGC